MVASVEAGKRFLWLWRMARPRLAREQYLSASVCLALALILVCGCGGSMRGISADQRETIRISYQDGFGTRDIQATSSAGEKFIGTLVWIKDIGAVGRYKGALVGDSGRTLQVEMECNTFTAKCVGTARDNTGALFFIR